MKKTPAPVFDEGAKRLLTILVGILILTLLILQPLLAYRSIFQWWSDNDPKGQYKCLSLTNLAYFHSNTLLYEIISLFTPESSKFDYTWWIYFITAFIQGQGPGVVDGLCTPKTLCGSLVPDSIPKNDYYTSAYNAKNKTGTAAWPTSKGGPNNNRREKPDTKPQDVTTGDDPGWGWLGAIMSWGNITYYPDAQSEKDIYLFDMDEWFKHPDNFLAQWGIPPNSGLVVGYITGRDVSPIDQQPVWGGLEVLLGMRAGFAAGGWFGFLQVNGDFGGRGLEEANRIIWATQESRPVPKSVTDAQKKSKSCNGANIANGAIGMGALGAMGLAAAGAAACGPLAVPTLGLSCAAWFGIGGAVAGAGLGAGLSVASQGCG